MAPLNVMARLAAGGALLAACLLVEKYRPLRRPTQPKLPRVLRNLTMGALGSVVLRLGKGGVVKGGGKGVRA